MFCDKGSLISLILLSSRPKLRQTVSGDWHTLPADKKDYEQKKRTLTTRHVA
jgi:hypothetical protein